jgi:hypothetical protein
VLMPVPVVMRVLMPVPVPGEAGGSG